MVVFPNAKINLGLNIESKRDDGYHNISSCFFPIPFQDVLEIIPADELSFSVLGLTIPGSTEVNLILKAYQLMAKDHSLRPVEIHLLKNIPMGAGLGGGSADCAFMINLLDDYFELNLTHKIRQEYAAKLGSDCSFFIRNRPAIATGRGEILKEIHLDLSGYFLKLICPDVHIGTAEAYANIVPAVPSENIQSIMSRPISEWQGKLVNDFEASVFPNHPGLATNKSKLIDAGALYASMTGSGSSFYGIFEHEVGTMTDHPEYLFEL